ncbi:MAG: hypothetical protein WAS33_11290 [Candidatus Promineifilaceae bacterium]
MLILFSLISLFFLLIGIRIRTGGFKALYLAKGIPVLIPRAIQNMFIPLGITFLIWGIVWSDFISNIEMGNRLFGFIVMPMMLVSIILGVWNPQWLRPRWLNYLEDEYGSVMWKLLDEARKEMPGWSRRVQTQAGLEEWAEETRIKLGYPPHSGQIERQAKARESK